MNEAVEKELKVVVEQAVRPVRATMSRKRRMREELLAHLESIIEVESRKPADEQAAMLAAKRRFGDPRELVGQLQQTVPWWDRCCSILENLGCQPSESARHLAGKHFLAMLLICAVYLPLWLLIHGNLRNLKLEPAELQYLAAIVMVGAVLVVALFNVILSLILAPLLEKIGPVLVLKRRARILLAGLCGLAVAVGLVLPLFFGAAVLLFLMARQAVKQWRYQAEWV
jgi:hypothetical protein